jgi:hypothetical protein
VRGLGVPHLDIAVDARDSEQESLHGIEGGEDGRGGNSLRRRDGIDVAAPADGPTARGDQISVPIDLRTEGKRDQESVFAAVSGRRGQSSGRDAR